MSIFEHTLAELVEIQREHPQAMDAHAVAVVKDFCKWFEETFRPYDIDHGGRLHMGPAAEEFIKERGLRT